MLASRIAPCKPEPPKFFELKYQRSIAFCFRFLGNFLCVFLSLLGSRTYFDLCIFSSFHSLDSLHRKENRVSCLRTKSILLVIFWSLFHHRHVIPQIQSRVNCACFFFPVRWTWFSLQRVFNIVNTLSHLSCLVCPAWARCKR